MSKTILITGGAGFIGSHVVRLFVNKYPDYKIVNLDKLTYAGNLENLSDIENKNNYIFEKGDIVDEGYIKELFDKYNFDGVVHLAAESHVDRSIINPMEFIMTNVVGTVNLLNAAKNLWKGNENGKLFYPPPPPESNYPFRSSPSASPQPPLAPLSNNPLPDLFSLSPAPVFETLFSHFPALQSQVLG